MRKVLKSMKIVVMTVMLLGLALGGVLITHTSSGAAMQVAQKELKTVVSNEVCMVNDKVFGKPQIPVEFEGKTYYGCCEGCVGRIKNDKTVRYSKDPITGQEVDKAVAVIIEGSAGEALYFESADTAQKYNEHLRN